MAKLRHRIPHTRKVLYEQTLQEGRIMPGMIISFTYTSENIYDRKPLFFVFNRQGDRINGMNLNYLNEGRVQRFFKFAQTLTPVFEENVLGMNLPYIRLQLTDPKKPSSVDDGLLYRTVMPRDIYYKKAWRTYSLSKASSMKVVNYELDVLATKVGRRSMESLKKRKNIKQEIKGGEINKEIQKGDEDK
jgi:hypothetical protein